MDLININERIRVAVNEKLCKKGEAYRRRRMAAGEKSSAYLSGRAVKVCKGQMQGENTDPDGVLDGDIDSFLEAALYQNKKNN